MPQRLTYELRHDQHPGFILSDDPARIDRATVLDFLHNSHWGQSTTAEILDRAIANSVNVGVYDPGGALVAFARAVTDRATYAYLTDVFVLESARGRGLGRWVVEGLLAHPDLQGLRRLALMTRDAPWLYEKLGFTTDIGISTYMQKKLL